MCSRYQQPVGLEESKRKSVKIWTSQTFLQAIFFKSGWLLDVKQRGERYSCSCSF